MVWRTVGKGILFALGSLCYALLGVLSQLSKSPDGSYAYSMPSVVFLAEAVKLCLSFAFLSAETGSPLAAIGDVLGGPPMRWAAFAVPSVLYSLNNNLDMLNNQHMDPATEQVLVQGKILTTGIVWWLVFQEPLGTRKWVALILLFCGTVLAGWPSDDKPDPTQKIMYIDTIGVFLVILYIWVSASAGVYNEWLYKYIGKGESIHTANIRLYTIGCIVNLSGFVASSSESHRKGGLLTGYNSYTWGLVATYALMGLLLAQVMKFFDNIVKLFISGSSMYVSAVLSWLIFGYTPTTTFLAALVLVTVAIILYNAEKIFKLHAI
jgi:UDP-galactose transporter